MPIERLNARSIFSLVASQQDCEACEACRAWLAVFCAPLAAIEPVVFVSAGDKGMSEGHTIIALHRSLTMRLEEYQGSP